MPEPDDRPRYSLDPEPKPGEVCHACGCKLPPTPLELWMVRNGETFESMAARLTLLPEVQDRLAELRARREPTSLKRAPNIGALMKQMVKRRRAPEGDRVSKNLIWRLNHQAPGWKGPLPRSLAFRVQPALLEITGLRAEDLQNMSPITKVYSCGNAAWREAHKDEIPF